MNHLAHLHLADRTPASRLGNLMGDFIKGRAALADLDPEVRLGVMVHRRVDAFTDAHEASRAAAELLRPQWGRLAPMIVDVVFDHYLARSWNDWESQPLREFADGCYADLAAWRQAMPPVMQRVTEAMREGDWLVAIRSPEGLEQALGRLSYRLRRKPVDLRPAVVTVWENDSGFVRYFGSAYTDLRAFVRAEQERLRAE